MSTPEDGMAVILAGATKSRKQKFVEDLLAEKRNLPPNVPPQARRAMIEAAVRATSGRSQIELNTELATLYDELHGLGALENPRANR